MAARIPVGGGGMYFYSPALSACIIYSMDIIKIVIIVPSRKYKKYKYSEQFSLK